MNEDKRHVVLQAALAAARLSAGLTQIEVAARIGKPQSFVSKYESGERSLNVCEFVDVCEAIGCDAAMLINELKATHV